MIADIEENIPHEVAELICLKCHKRWLGVYPEETPLSMLQCVCGEVGYVIKTGQTLPNPVLPEPKDIRYYNLKKTYGEQIAREKFEAFCK